MNIGNAIKKIRTEQGLSQGEFAQKCEISQTSISQIENGVKRPNPGSLKKICKVLHVPESILYLYGLEEKDIPEGKKELYQQLFPTVEDMIKRLVTA